MHWIALDQWVYLLKYIDVYRTMLSWPIKILQGNSKLFNKSQIREALIKITHLNFKHPQCVKEQHTVSVNLKHCSWMTRKYTEQIQIQAKYTQVDLKGNTFSETHQLTCLTLRVQEKQQWKNKYLKTKVKSYILTVQ